MGPFSFARNRMKRRLTAIAARLRGVDWKDFFRDLVAFAGAAAVVNGIRMHSVPSAWVVAGFVLIGISWSAMRAD